MNAFLLTWNTNLHDGDSVVAAAHRFLDGDRRMNDDWSTTRTRGFASGDRVFLVAVGTPKRGIVATGTVLDPEVSSGPHWSGNGGSAYYIKIEWDTAVFLDEALPVSSLKEIDPETHWTPQSSGVLLDPAVADALEQAWTDHLNSRGDWQWAEVQKSVNVKGDEISRAYRFTLQKIRLHQRKFRQLLLDSYENECAYCGIDVIEVLEAAHIKPDSLGGEASVENGRLLCANHHKAFDKKILHWNVERQAFELPAGSSPVPPLPKN